MVDPRSPYPVLFLARPGLRWEELDDEYIVFNPLSDEIHRLNTLAAVVLAELEAMPLGMDELGTRVANLLTVSLDDTIRQQLRTILARFDELGLIAPAPRKPGNHGR